MMPKPFQIFGPSHIAVLCLIVLLVIVFSLIARRSRRAGDVIAKGVAIMMLATQLVYMIHCATRDPIPWARLMPMELCEWIIIIAAIALWTRRQLPYVLTYFWGMAGTLQATITPDLAYDFPHLFFFVFFLVHMGILIAALYLTFGYGMRPTARSILTAFWGLFVYLAVASVVNAVFETNYGYLCRKPFNPSLYDYLGPWPWYIAGLGVFSLCAFAVLYLPFLLFGRSSKKSCHTGDHYKAG